MRKGSTSETMNPLAKEMILQLAYDGLRLKYPVLNLPDLSGDSPSKMELALRNTPIINRNIEAMIETWRAVYDDEV